MARNARRGSHRPVPCTLTGAVDQGNRPRGPSLQGGRVSIQRRTIWPSVSQATEAVLFNGLPLLLLAAAYAALTGAVLPLLWRDRARAHPIDWAIVLVFPGFAMASGIFGVLVLRERQPFGGHTWLSFA